MYFVLEFGFQASVAEFRNCLTNLGAIEEVLKPKLMHLQRAFVCVASYDTVIDKKNILTIFYVIC
jgi:hypothetical protein